MTPRSPARRSTPRGGWTASPPGPSRRKTLNVPSDCGIAVVRDRDALRAAMGMHGDYLIRDAAGDPFVFTQVCVSFGGDERTEEVRLESLQVAAK